MPIHQSPMKRYCVFSLLQTTLCLHLISGFLLSSPSPSSGVALSMAKPDPNEKYHVRFLNRLGFQRVSQRNQDAVKSQRKQQTQYEITTQEELDAYFADEQERFRTNKGTIDYNSLIRSLNVQGDTQIIGSNKHPEYTHPVLKLIHERRKYGNNSTKAAKVALAIEGGGMRGCISAGMICAIHYLNLTDSIDVVYGSSAGTIIGAYLITNQLPWFGPEVYYDCLTTAGKEFIDTKRLLRALGFGLLDPRLLRDVVTRPAHGKPVLNLPYLLKTCLQELKPLDWKTFVDKQKVQPLKVVASGCKSEKAVVLDYTNGAFSSISELADCMHASCLLPGIAGPLMNLDTRALRGGTTLNKFVLGNNIQDDHFEPLADALLFEPLPYRSAIDEGATHIIVVRSRPDGTDVTGKGGIFEKLIFRRFFLRKNKLPNMYKRLKQQLHKKLYAEDVIRLNDEAYNGRDYNDISKPHIMTIALPPGSPEVSRLETGREAIFEGLRRGFARAYDCLVDNPAERGRGEIMAKFCLPDEILDYHPLSVDSGKESAFSVYLRERGVCPKAWTGDDQMPLPTRPQEMNVPST